MSNKAPNPNQNKPNHLQVAKERVAAGQLAFCIHPSWGIGVIRGYDDNSKRFTLDFPEQKKTGHQMEESLFKNGKIEFIDPNQTLAAAFTDSSKEKIAKLVATNPAELVKIILAEFDTGECTSYALEAMLERIHFASLEGSSKDAKAAFKSWWTKARAQLRKDRAILIPERKGGLYALLQAPKDLGEDLFAQYETAPNFERKLAILEELANSTPEETRSATTEANLAKVSGDLAKAIAGLTGTRRLSHLPHILMGIWNRDKFFRPSFDQVETVSPTASDVIALCSDDDLVHLALNIQHTTEKIRSLLDLMRAHHGDNWPQRTLKLLHHQDVAVAKSGSAKLISESIAYLCDKAHAPLVAERFTQWLESRELRAPLIIWIIKVRGTKKYAEIVDRLINPALLSTIFASIDTEALESTSSARIPLANELTKDRELISDILAPKDGPKVDSETIFDLSRLMLRSQGFDPITKKNLLTRIAKIEPTVLSLAEQSKDSDGEADEKVLYVSQWSKDEKDRELDNLVRVRIPEINEAVQRAKELGDLKENSEYKMARQEQQMANVRRGELENMLKRAVVFNFNDAKADSIQLGTSIRLLRKSDQTEIAYDILGVWDSNVEAGVLSYISPLAKQFLKHKLHEDFSTNINGRTENWKVLSIERWADKKK